MHKSKTALMLIVKQGRGYLILSYFYLAVGDILKFSHYTLPLYGWSVELEGGRAAAQAFLVLSAPRHPSKEFGRGQQCAGKYIRKC